jgi:hypothetical protein
LWCWKTVTSGSRSEICGKFGNVVLEKEGDDQFDRPCESEEVLYTVKEERKILLTIKQRKANWKEIYKKKKR